MAVQRPRGRKTDYSWGHFCGAGVLDNAVGAVVLGSNGFLSTNAQTLTRTHGLVVVELDPTAVDERVLLAWGLIVVSENAFGAGVASVPTPIADPGEDWFAYGHLWVSSGGGALLDLGLSSLSHRHVVDSKAMRKVKGGETVALVAEVCSSVDQGGTMELQFGFRMLFGR